MSYTAKVFNVMIASPGDVASERAIIREVLYEWNSVHSKSRNIVLLPIGWETHSSPEMGSSPQSIINEQILDKCDFLVGVFWTRIGTATDKYASGSVEEIENHIELKKPVMLYFSGQPVAMDTVNLDQVKELKTFKDSCKSKGLYEEYDSHSDFKEKFYRHLQLKLNEHPLFKDIEADGIGEVVESKMHIPSLTKESRTLLKEASLDSHGTIMSLRMMGGNAIQTNGKNFITSRDRREEALWEAAIQELVENDLIFDPGRKGEVFQLTNKGYETSDMIGI